MQIKSTSKYNKVISAFNADIQTQINDELYAQFNINLPSFLNDADLMSELEFNLRHGKIIIAEVEYD